MQIACHRFSCQKAVEVCYWACKYRKNCKDWRQALEGEPGVEPIRARLEMASAKSGRVFDLVTLTSPGRKRRAAPVQSEKLVKVDQIDHREDQSEKREKVKKAESIKPEKLKAEKLKAEKVKPVKVKKAVKKAEKLKAEKLKAEKIERYKKVRMTEKAEVVPLQLKPQRRLRKARVNPNPHQKGGESEIMAKPATSALNETDNYESVDSPSPVTDIASVAKKRGRKVGAKKPKPATSGPVYLVLSPNGKYREVSEDELASEAAHLLKDTSLRLVKGQFMIPQITFRLADE
jgi:hypothetical protein